MEAALDDHLEDLFAGAVGVWLGKAVAVVERTRLLSVLDELVDDDRLWLPDGRPAVAPQAAALALPMPLVRGLAWVCSHPSANRETLREAFSDDMLRLAIRANAIAADNLPAIAGELEH